MSLRQTFSYQIFPYNIIFLKKYALCEIQIFTTK